MKRQKRLMAMLDNFIWLIIAISAVITGLLIVKNCTSIEHHMMYLFFVLAIAYTVK